MIYSQCQMKLYFRLLAYFGVKIDGFELKLGSFA
jgi:hypothetical protein